MGGASSKDLVRQAVKDSPARGPPADFPVPDSSWATWCYPDAQQSILHLAVAYECVWMVRLILENSAIFDSKFLDRVDYLGEQPPPFSAPCGPT